MRKLNPFNDKRREAEKKLQEERHKKRVAALKGARKDKKNKADKKGRNATYKKLQDALVDSYKAAKDKLQWEENLNNMGDAEDDE